MRVSSRGWTRLVTSRPYGITSGPGPTSVHPATRGVRRHAENRGRRPRLSREGGRRRVRVERAEVAMDRDALRAQYAAGLRAEAERRFGAARAEALKDN